MYNFSITHCIFLYFIQKKISQEKLAPHKHAPTTHGCTFHNFPLLAQTPHPQPTVAHSGDGRTPQFPPTRPRLLAPHNPRLHARDTDGRTGRRIGERGHGERTGHTGVNTQKKENLALWYMLRASYKGENNL